eukprot:122822_1
MMQVKKWMIPFNFVQLLWSLQLNFYLSTSIMDNLVKKILHHGIIVIKTLWSRCVMVICIVVMWEVYVGGICGSGLLLRSGGDSCGFTGYVSSHYGNIQQHMVYEKRV